MGLSHVIDYLIGYTESWHTPGQYCNSAAMHLLVLRTAYYLMYTCRKTYNPFYTQTELKSYCSNQATNYVPTPDNTLIILSID